ncbi:JDVT-CTERM system glutamic-type intramembrane protease MrtJ [Thiohalorhabdus methylotrophus]|uniref:JDVT-CTERM system glutamic-type intramembrane protease n=1 Tax=Thiohalorhabdus methylotrophus TaxID=3242694 RepID=A0ABV4TSX5_9GAMM
MLGDPRFRAALAAGPLFWLLLLAAGFSPARPEWALERPGLFLSLALLYPVAEEVLFRGLLQEALARRLPTVPRGPLSSANLATSAAFSALHFPGHPPLWAAGVFLPSLLFGYFKDRYGRLSAPITLHATYNSGYYLLLFQPP